MTAEPLDLTALREFNRKQLIDILDSARRHSIFLLQTYYSLNSSVNRSVVKRPSFWTTNSADRFR